MIGLPILLLSLGAVFAIIAGLLFYLPILNTVYITFKWICNNFILFIVLTISVNIIFFPMHFLGLAGMARRIIDYGDSYSTFNYYISFGSCITIIILVYFFLVLSKIFKSYFYSL